MPSLVNSGFQDSSNTQSNVFAGGTSWTDPESYQTSNTPSPKLCKCVIMRFESTHCPKPLAAWQFVDLLAMLRCHGDICPLLASSLTSQNYCSVQQNRTQNTERVRNAPNVIDRLKAWKALRIIAANILCKGFEDCNSVNHLKVRWVFV